MELFRELSEGDVVQFRAWARNNYEPLTPIKGIWHPVVQEECTKMNRAAELVIDKKLDKKLKTEEDN